jgi:hypothetical protein
LVVDSELPEHPVAPDAQCAPAEAFGDASAAALVVVVLSLTNQPRRPVLSSASRTFDVVSHPPALAWQCALLDASPLAFAESAAAWVAVAVFWAVFLGVAVSVARRPVEEVSQPPPAVWQSPCASASVALEESAQLFVQLPEA